MLLSTRKTSRNTLNKRTFYCSAASKTIKQVAHPYNVDLPQRNVQWRRLDYLKTKRDVLNETQDYPKQNEVGVQMLSRKLHTQLFKGVTFSPPDKRYISLAREHLAQHGLDRTQGSVAPNISFALPPLLGRSIDEHFHRIGSQVGQPWLDLAKQFTTVELPPRPDYWHIQPGWTKYHHREDGTGYSMSIPAPDEEVLSLDVETKPNRHPYAVMACAVSSTHWYSWISPWLFDPATADSEQLMPLGNPERHRLVIGHNVSYDRARLLEEYNLKGTNTRFLDTMSLHVAVKGISSHQRPAWMKYRKSKSEELQRNKEAAEAAADYLELTRKKRTKERDAKRREELLRMQQELEESLSKFMDEGMGTSEVDAVSKRWEDITSANSLADVAKLHCDIEMDKGIRDDFMACEPNEILTNIQDYLDYCSKDALVTHAVYAKVFPEFLEACPSPVSFSGVLTMGSCFLTVNEKWEEYLRNAENAYRELEESIKKQLIDLAMQAKLMIDDGSWKDDVWLSQLDWTPKVPGKSRGVHNSSKLKLKEETFNTKTGKPEWYNILVNKGPFSEHAKNHIVPLLLRLAYDGHPLQYSNSDGWTYRDGSGAIYKPGGSATIVRTILGKMKGVKAIRNKRMTCINVDIALAIAEGETSEDLAQEIMALAEDVLTKGPELSDDPWISQLSGDYGRRQQQAPVVWPKWYWELTRPRKDMPPGSLDITVRSRVAPLLLKLKWACWPLLFSREYGWIFRVAPDTAYETRSTLLKFHDPADTHLQEMTLRGGYKFYKLPHKDGESANVGSPFGKTFVKYAQDDILTSFGRAAMDALDMNAQCSYWISARDRILKQMVVWESTRVPMGIDIGTQSEVVDQDDRHKVDGSVRKWGMVIPQVITMGTVTRRAIEKTWLTASNAKKNRIGSELKAMVRAPPGYAIVGADVDSEELWISSAIGDAQFGLHGATALGWMTLEGTKAAGTDLHSKTASILSLTRDQAKVFNYSRIYGAGMRHALLLLLQSNPNMLHEVAQKQAGKLYTSTKGRNTHRADIFGRKFWFGGTESFVFNKLEEIALSDKPQTPALGCGITHALSKEYLEPGFGTDYMTSRINWVVQSSGVDYLHLLIVAMEYLLRAYDIRARYLLSVHDELRYLVAFEDRYRAALALQIANIWTRVQFAFRLGMDDLPQGVAFFSAVDIDRVLRKEVDMECVTPSQHEPIAPGESLNIGQVLEKTNDGSLWPDGRLMDSASFPNPKAITPSPMGYTPPNCLTHRATSANFLRAQATTEFGEIKRLAECETGQRFAGDVGSGASDGRSKSSRGHPCKEASANKNYRSSLISLSPPENLMEGISENELANYAANARRNYSSWKN